MRLHQNARTCPASRRLMCERIDAGWSLAAAAEAAGVSDRRAREWRRRWEAGELASAGDDDHVVRLAARFHAAVDVVQALLGAVADREDVLGLAGLTLGERGAQARSRP